MAKTRKEQFLYPHDLIDDLRNQIWKVWNYAVDYEKDGAWYTEPPKTDEQMVDELVEWICQNHLLHYKSFDCIKVSLPALLEIMRFKACPRPDIGDDNWIKVVECMEETIGFAEECYKSAFASDRLFEEAKREREQAGEEMTPIMP